MKHKIGEIITITEDFEIETAIGGQKLQVKKGDKGFIDGKGMIHYITGKAGGKIQPSDAEMCGYAYEDIAELILKRLNGQFDLTEVLRDNDIEPKDFKNEIEDVLMNIL